MLSNSKTVPIYRFTILIVLAILIPILLNAFHTWLSAQEDEELLSDVYNRQLETVLFTANQETSRLVSSYFDEFNANYVKRTNGSLKALYQYDIAEQSVQFISGINEKAPYLDSVKAILNSKKINSDTQIALVYEGMSDVFFYHAEKKLILQLRTYEFIKQDLVPLLSYYLGSTIQFSISDKKSGTRFDSNNSELRDAPFLEKSVWIFPNLTLKAQIKDEQIETLRSSKNWRGFIITLLVALILISATVFFYRVWLKEQKVAQLKSDFVANVSHELKTPIALIRMNAETLGMGRIKDETKQKHYLTVIEQESERLTHLINNVLNFSKLETGKKTYQLREVNLEDHLNKVLNRYETFFQQKGFQIQVDIQPELPKIKADANDLDEIILNLVDNAIKYSSDKKEVLIKVYTKSNQVICDIIDFGKGIDKKDLNYIFEPFFRVEDSLTQQTKGTGLGLTLVKDMMNGIGGTISVQSELGKGSTFRLTFPHI